MNATHEVSVVTLTDEEFVLRGGDPRARAARERVLVVGATPLTQMVMREMRRDGSRATVVGVVPEVGAPGGMRAPSSGSLDRLARIIRETRPHRIVVDVDARQRERIAPALVAALGAEIVVEEAVETYEQLTGKAALEALGPGHVMFSQAFRAGRVQAAFARALSLASALIGLTALAPLFLILPVLIKLDSAGPVFFVQPRLGRGGRPFRLLKFRTMRPGNTGSEWVRDNRDRITPLGAVLRRFRLDELPQLVNVLRGEMDLVGPRPHPVSNRAMFMASIPFYPLRLVVRPGVTGWAQVQYGYANDLREETEKMRYDLYYIKHRSVALDLWILLLTLKVVLFGSGVAAAGMGGDHADWETAA